MFFGMCIHFLFGFICFCLFLLGFGEGKFFIDIMFFYFGYCFCVFWLNVCFLDLKESSFDGE